MKRLAAFFCLCLPPVLTRAQSTWDGGDATGNWTAPLNWAGDTAPAPGAALAFAGALGLSATNDFAAGTAFGGLTFNAGAGAFVLRGNAVQLAGNVVNNSSAGQRVALDMNLGATNRLFQANAGNLTLDGVISGAHDAQFTGAAAKSIFLNTPGTWTGGDTFVGQTGTTPVSNFTVVQGADDVFPVGSTVSVQAPSSGTGHTARWDLNGFDQTVFALRNLGGNTRIITNSSATPSLLTITSGNGLTYSSQLTGNLSVLKLGPGRQDLTHNSTGFTMTGEMVIREGALGFGVPNGPTNAPLVLDGGYIQNSLASTFTRSIGLTGGNAVRWTANGGGFSARGGIHTVNLGGQSPPLALDWGDGVGTNVVGVLRLVHSGSADNRLLFRNGLNLNGTNRVMDVGDNAGSTADLAELAGAIADGAGGAAGLIKQGPGLLSLTATNTFSAGLAILGGTVQAALIADAGVSLLGFGPLTLNGGALEHTATGTGTNSTARAWSVGAAGGALRVTTSTRVLEMASPPTGSGALTLAGNGMIALPASAPGFSGTMEAGAGTASTFNGTTGTAAGFLRLGADQALGTGLINARGIQFRASAPTVALDNPIDIQAGGLRFGPGGTVVLNGDLTVIGSLRALGVYAGTGAVVLNGAVNLGVHGLSVEGTEGSTAAAVTVNGSIGGSSAFQIHTSYDAGVVTLNGDNTFTGGLQVNSSRVRLGHDGAAGRGGITVNTTVGAGLSSVGSAARSITNQLAVTVTTALGHATDNGHMTFTKPVNLSNGSRTFTVNSDATFAAAFTNGTLAVKQGPGTLTVRGNFTNAAAMEVVRGALVVEQGTSTSGDALRAYGTTAGAGARLDLLASATNLIAATASNLRVGYSTGAAVTNVVHLHGALLMTPGGTGARALLGPLGARNELHLHPGSRLSTRQVGEESGTSTCVVNLNGALIEVLPDSSGINARHPAFMQGLDEVNLLAGGLTLQTFTNTVTIAQNLRGPGGLVKRGAGSLFLTGTNLTHLGTTEVREGELRLDGGLNGGGALRVSAGARLTGSGVCLGPVEIAAGGVFAPGAGALPVFNAAADLDVQGEWQVDVSGASADLVSGIDRLTLGPASRLSIAGVLTAPSYVIARYTDRTGTFADTSALNGTGYTVAYDDLAGEVRLVAPAPPMLGLLPGGLSWPGYLGRLYTVEYRTNLLSGAWAPVPGFSGVAGTGAPLSFTNLISGDVRGYYRVKEE